MPSETRWLRNEQDTINGLTAWLLHLSRITAEYDFSKTIPFYQGGTDVGVRIWKRDSGGVETEITAGTPVAQVSYTDGDAKVTRSNTWICPETALTSTDSIVMRVYAYLHEAWVLISFANFTTEQLGATQLDSATWTVYYTCSFSGVMFPNPKCMIALYIDGTNNSRITNFTWSVVVPPPAKPLINKPLVNPILVNVPCVRIKKSFWAG